MDAALRDVALARLGIYGTLALSLVVVPAALTAYLHAVGPPPEESLRLYAVALVALAPGALMGGAGLLVAARG